MRTTKLPISECLACGAVNDACSDTGSATPSPGDISICLYCGYVSAFDETLHLRPLTATESREIAECAEFAGKFALRNEVAKRLKE